MKTKQEMFKQIEIQGQLPTLPFVITKVLNMLTDPDISAREIAKVISTDVSLSSKTLKLVNSAFYGFPKKVTTINQAIVILGFNTVKSAVFGTAIINAFEQHKKKLSINYNNFWAHSVAVGAASRVLSKHIKYSNIEEAFIGGVIHDIGKLVLSIFNNNEYNKVIEKVKDKQLDITLCDIEKEIFGYDHSEIGTYLAEKWNFPQKLTGVIKYHHKPNKASEDFDKKLISIVSIANIFVNILKIGNSGNYYIDRISQESWKMLNLKTSNLESIYDSIKEEYKLATIFLN